MRAAVLLSSLIAGWGSAIAGADAPAPAPTLGDVHAGWDRLVKAHVRDGYVEYAGFQKEEKELDKYLSFLAATDPAKLDRPARLALLLNAYNAFTIKLILERYPSIKSIKDIPRRWDQVRWTIGGKKHSLGQIEHDILRKEMKEPRVHFALVCAARSCPNLRSEAYAPGRIDEQLEDQARRFLSDPGKGFRFAREKGVLFGFNNNVYLSSIFKWFGEDFEAGGKSVLDYVLPLLPAAGRKFVEEHKDDIDIRYLDYDWSLNGR